MLNREIYALLQKAKQLVADQDNDQAERLIARVLQALAAQGFNKTAEQLHQEMLDDEFDEDYA